jgi:hypothetical protein
VYASDETGRDTVDVRDLSTADDYDTETDEGRQAAIDKGEVPRRRTHEHVRLGRGARSGASAKRLRVVCS